MRFEGFVDAVQMDRLRWLAEHGRYLAVYGGSRPDSSGEGGAEVTTGIRPQIAWSEPALDVSGNVHITNSAQVSYISPIGGTPEQLAMGLMSVMITAIGICPSPIGNPVYICLIRPRGLTRDHPVTFAPGTITCYAGTPPNY